MDPSSDLVARDDDTLQTIFAAAVQVRAQEIRFTAYRPHGDVSINFKIVHPSGQSDLVKFRSEELDYKTGFRLIKGLFERFGTPPVNLPPGPINDDVRCDINDVTARTYGLARARLVLKPIRDNHSIDGCTVAIDLTYALSPQQSHLA